MSCNIDFEDIRSRIAKSNIGGSQNPNKYPIQEQATLVEIWEYVSCECNDNCTCRKFGCTHHWTLKQNVIFGDILPAFLRMFVNKNQHRQIIAHMNDTTLTSDRLNKRVREVVPVLQDIRSNWRTLYSEVLNHKKTLVCDDWYTSFWKKEWNFSLSESVYKAKRFCVLLPDIGIPYDSSSRPKITSCLSNGVSTYFQMLKGLRSALIDIMERESQSLVNLRKLDSPHKQLPFNPSEISLPRNNFDYGNTYAPEERPISRIIDKSFYNPHETEVSERKTVRQPMRLAKQATHPLSGRGKPIYWQNHSGGRRVRWGIIRFNLSDGLTSDILNDYFRDRRTWYPLGASMTNPIRGGLGEYVQKNCASLTPRHASAIAAILVQDNLIESRGNKPIELRKL